MTVTRTDPPRPSAESIRPEDVVQRILEANAEEAWTVLRETILTPPRQTMLPHIES